MVFFLEIHEIVEAINRLFSMFTFINILRWIYYSEDKGLHRVTFDGLEHQVVVNLTSRAIGIEIGMCSYRFKNIV